MKKAAGAKKKHVRPGKKKGIEKKGAKALEPSGKRGRI